MPERILMRKAAPRKDICLFIDNGQPCHRPVASRGLCGAHRLYLIKIGKLEEYAMPLTSRKRQLEVNPSPKEGMCRVAEGGHLKVRTGGN